MTATPNKTKSKLTYADRVVRALSEYQRAHKKHAVHLATLRAQVRKDADADRDQLGAQWSHWVTRAANKLAEQGVLEVSGGQYYTLSSETKKNLIAARRQSFSIAPGTPSRADQLWKSVITGTHTSRGIKRRLTDEVDEPVTPMKSISTRRKSSSRKRARRSSVKGVSRMTKAELLEALQNAEDEQSEEVYRLREELAALRHQLEDTRQEDSISSTPPSYSRDLTPLTPLPVRETSPPVLMVETVSTVARHPVSTATRTQSGSIIPEATRQPTPAPSDLGDDVDMHQDSFHYDSAQARPERVFGLATPTYTPLTSKTNLPPVADEDVHALLEARVSELQTLRDTHGRLAAEHATLKENVASREARISALQAEVKEKADLLGAQQQDLSTARILVLHAQSEITSMSQTLQENTVTLADARKALEDMEASMIALVTEKARRDARLAESERALEMLEAEYEARKLELAQDETSLPAKTDIVDLTARLAAADASIAVLTKERATAIAGYEAVRDELAATQVTMATFERELTLLRETVAQREGQVTDLTEQLALAEQEITLLREELEAEAGRAAVLAGEKDAALAQLAALSKELEDVTQRLQALASDLVEKDATIVKLEGSVSSGQAQIADLASQMEQLEADKTTVQLSADELKEGLAAKDTILAEANAALKVQQEMTSGLETQLAASMAKNADLASELSADADMLDAAQTQLQEAQASERDLHAQLENLRLEKEASGRMAEAQIEALETSLQAAQEDVATLQARMQSAEQAHGELAGRFEQSTIELAAMRAALQSEKERAAALDTRLSSTFADKETLARQAAGWAKVKAQDDATIEKLRRIVQRHEVFFKGQLAEISREATILVPASPTSEAISMRVAETPIAYSS